MARPRRHLGRPRGPFRFWAEVTVDIGAPSEVVRALVGDLEVRPSWWPWETATDGSDRSAIRVPWRSAPFWVSLRMVPEPPSTSDEGDVVVHFSVTPAGSGARVRWVLWGPRPLGRWALSGFARSSRLRGVMSAGLARLRAKAETSAADHVRWRPRAAGASWDRGWRSP